MQVECDAAAACVHVHGDFPTLRHAMIDVISRDNQYCFYALRSLLFAMYMYIYVWARTVATHRRTAVKLCMKNMQGIIQLTLQTRFDIAAYQWILGTEHRDINTATN